MADGSTSYRTAATDFRFGKPSPIPAIGAEHAVQVTKQGGFAGWESHDGQRFYYAKRNDPSCLWQVASNGGVEAEVICPLSSWHYIAMFPDGIYYAPRVSTQIWFFSFAD